MRFLIFNPENDLALASNDPHYTPPASARQMAADLQDLPRLWAEEGDVIVQTRTLLRESSILPWGWSPLLVCQLRERGVPDSLLPTDEQMTEYRNFASRETAVRLLKRLRTQWTEPFHSEALVGESTWCSSEAQVLCAIADYGGDAMLKAPWSGSGRGVHPVHELPLSVQTQRWVRRTLQTQGGVEVEPLYNKVQDLAMEFWAEGGHVRYEGLSLFETTAGGVYAGNLVATEQEKETRLATYIPLTLLDEVRERLTHLLNEAGLPAWYTGPVGIDMMIVKKLSTLNSQLSARPNGALDLSRTFNYSFHPLVELNLRMTMGWVALQLTSQLQHGETGTFSIDCQDGHYQVLVNKHTPVINR